VANKRLKALLEPHLVVPHLDQIVPARHNKPPASGHSQRVHATLVNPLHRLAHLPAAFRLELDESILRRGAQKLAKISRCVSEPDSALAAAGRRVGDVDAEEFVECRALVDSD